MSDHFIYVYQFGGFRCCSYRAQRIDFFLLCFNYYMIIIIDSIEDLVTKF